MTLWGLIMRINFDFRKLIYIAIAFVMLVSCTTTRPQFTMIRPSSPVYQRVPDDAFVPLEVVNNTIYMLDYISKLEIYADNLEQYINEIQ